MANVLICKDIWGEKHQNQYKITDDHKSIVVMKQIAWFHFHALEKICRIILVFPSKIK